MEQRLQVADSQAKLIKSDIPGGTFFSFLVFFLWENFQTGGYTQKNNSTWLAKISNFV
jgi:hypothetical protein